MSSTSVLSPLNEKEDHTTTDVQSLIANYPPDLLEVISSIYMMQVKDQEAYKDKDSFEQKPKNTAIVLALEKLLGQLDRNISSDVNKENNQASVKSSQINTEKSPTFDKPFVHHYPKSDLEFRSEIPTTSNLSLDQVSRDEVNPNFSNWRSARTSRGKKPPAWAEKCASAVIGLIREFPPKVTDFSLGWHALNQIWNISPTDLDPCALQSLRCHSPRLQDHILLSFAAIDLSFVINLSAYLHCLIKEHDHNRQVCLYFLAGECDGICPLVHPVGTEGWVALENRWGLTYKDFDYNVLNYLAKMTVQKQNCILKDFASVNLSSVHNLSAYLSSVIQKREKFEQSIAFSTSLPNSTSSSANNSLWKSEDYYGESFSFNPRMNDEVSNNVEPKEKSKALNPQAPPWKPKEKKQLV